MTISAPTARIDVTGAVPQMPTTAVYYPLPGSIDVTGVVPALPGAVGTIAAPAATILVRARLGQIAPRLMVALVAPADDAVVPAARPDLVVAVHATTAEAMDADVEVAYATSTDFTAATVLTASVSAAAGSADLSVLAPDADLAGEVFWRARALAAGAATPWTPVRSFTVTAASTYTCPVTFTVTSGAPTPHLWLLDPDEAEPGTDVTIVGFGLPEDPIVRLGSRQLDVLAREAVAATGESIITAGAVGVAHERITVRLPADDESATDELSGAITVEGE